MFKDMSVRSATILIPAIVPGRCGRQQKGVRLFEMLGIYNIDEQNVHTLPSAVSFAEGRKSFEGFDCHATSRIPRNRLSSNEKE